MKRTNSRRGNICHCCWKVCSQAVLFTENKTNCGGDGKQWCDEYSWLLCDL